MIGSARPTRVRWLLVFWMFAISAIAYLDRVNISIAGQALRTQFGLTTTQLGTVFSAFVLGYALTQPVGGRLADRFGPRVVIFAGTVWWGVFTALTASVPAAVAHGLALLIGVRFTLGVGEAVVYPASNRLVASWIPRRERGRANGVIFAGVGVGAGLAPPLITYVMVTYGWRWSFWVSAVLGLAAGVVWLFLVRDTPASHPWANAAEVDYIAGSEQAALGAAAERPSAGSAPTLPWRAIITNPQVRLVTLSYFCYGYVAYIFFTWFFTYLNTVRGLNLRASAFYATLPFLSMAVGSSVGGVVSDAIARRFGQYAGRCGVALAGMLLAGLFVVLATQVQDARLASVVLAGGAGALYLSQSAFWSMSADLGGRSAGSVSGVMNMGNQIGGTITASLTPYLAERFGWTPSFVVAAIVCLVGALTWAFVRPGSTESGARATVR